MTASPLKCDWLRTCVQFDTCLLSLVSPASGTLRKPEKTRVQRREDGRNTNFISQGLLVQPYLSPFMLHSQESALSLSLSPPSVLLVPAAVLSPSFLHIPSHPSLPPPSLSPSPSCAAGSSEWEILGSSGFFGRGENIATRGRVNKAYYLATPPVPPGNWRRPASPLAEAAPRSQLLLCNAAVSWQRQIERRCERFGWHLPISSVTRQLV